MGAKGMANIPLTLIPLSPWCAARLEKLRRKRTNETLAIQKAQKTDGLHTLMAGLAFTQRGNGIPLLQRLNFLLAVPFHNLVTFREDFL